MSKRLGTMTSFDSSRPGEKKRLPASADDMYFPDVAQQSNEDGELALGQTVELEEGAGTSADELIELLLAAGEARPVEPPPRIEGVVVGRILGIDAGGAVRVTFPGGPSDGLCARALASLSAEDVGRDVALMFEGGDPERPLVMGRMHTASTALRPEVQADGGRLEFEAEKEIVLRCGDASITLTRAGKILIRGAYVLSRSSGVNRIQGGTVEIN